MEADAGEWSDATESTKMHKLYWYLVSLIFCGAADVSNNHYSVSNCYPKPCNHICFMFFNDAFIKDSLKLKRGQRSCFRDGLNLKVCFFFQWLLIQIKCLYKCLVLLHQKVCIHCFQISRTGPGSITLSYSLFKNR